MRNRRDSSGIALPTALFIVLVLYSLITVTVSQVNQNVQFTRYSHLKTRAHYIAQAAVNQAIKTMSEDSTWESSHTGEAQAYSEDTASDERLKAWIIPHAAKPDLLYIHGQGIINPGNSYSIVQNFETVVRRVSNLSSIVYASRSILGPDMIYYKKGEDDWKALPPAPKMYYDESFNLQNATPASQSDYADNMKCLCGDNQGNLYAIWNRSGGNTIYKYSLSTNEWTAVRPPSSHEYGLNGKITTSSAPVKTFSDLASDGKDNLYAIHHSLLGTDTLYHCDLTTGEWDVLPPTKKSYYLDDGKLHIEDIIGGDLKDLTADKSGNVYVRYTFFDFLPDFGEKFGISDTVYRYSGQDNEWQTLPSVPVSYYTIQDSILTLITPSDTKKTGKISCLATSKDGTLYGRYAREGVDTIYRFTSSGEIENNGILKGMWGTIAPPSKVLYDYLNTPPANSGSSDDGEEVPNPNFDRSAVDGSGNLYMRYHKTGIADTIYSYKEGNEPAYDTLPAIPMTRYKWINNTDTASFEAVVKLNIDGTPKTEDTIDDLGAGGDTGTEGSCIYVVVSHY